MVDRRRQQEERDGFLGHLMLSQAAAKAWLNVYSSVRRRTKTELLSRRAVSVTREYFSLSYELGPFGLSLAWAWSECIRGAGIRVETELRHGKLETAGKRFCPPFVGLAHGQGCCVLSGYLPELEVVAGWD